MSSSNLHFRLPRIRMWLTRDKHAATDDTRAKFAPHICVLIVLALNLAFYAKAAPTLRLVELSVCREYYLEHDASKIGQGGFVEEVWCKRTEIQTKVAWLFMADELLHFCCDFLATMPLGIIADRYGPRPVMIVNFAGLILSWAWVLLICTFYNTFRSEMMLLASTFCLFGGATHFNTAIIYSEAAIWTQDRTTMFSILELAIQIGQLTGPVIGSALMLTGIYSPFYFVFPISTISLPLAFALPPTRNSEKEHKRRFSDEMEPLRQPDERDELLSGSHVVSMTVTSAASKAQAFRELLAGSFQEFLRCWRIFTEWKVIQYGYAAALVVTLGKQILHILLQYVSKRFGVTIAEAGMLFSVKAAVVIALYLAILPGLQRSLPGNQVDKTVHLARTSIVFLMIGITFMGLAWSIVTLIPGLIMYALGFGYPITVRSLLSELATKHSLPIPVIFAGMAVAETTGSFVGATVLTGAFTRTLDFEGWARGLPFFIGSGFYFMILVPTWYMNLQREFYIPEVGTILED